MKHSIIITAQLKDKQLEKIRSELPDAEIHFIHGDHTVSEHHGACTAYLGIPTLEEIKACRKLKFVQAGYAGVDSMPEEVIKNPEIAVASAKGIHNTQMSELFFAMMLYCGRNMSAWEKQKKTREWNKDPIKETFFLAEKSLCIIGYGSIGKKIAMIAQTFDMRVTGVRSKIGPGGRNADPFADLIIPTEELSEVLPAMDIVLNLLPLTRKTKDFFNSDLFGSMKKDAVFVNLGRGATVDEDALLDALDNGIIGYAALDVFREEPLAEDHPFWKHPRIILTPHIGGLMPDYWGAVADIFIENMKRLDRGEGLLNEVDKEKGY